MAGGMRPGYVMANALSACFQPWVLVPNWPPLVVPRGEDIGVEILHDRSQGSPTVQTKQNRRAATHRLPRTHLVDQILRDQLSSEIGNGCRTQP